MITIDIRELPARLDEILALADNGQEVTLADGATLFAKLIPFAKPKAGQRIANMHPGSMTMAPDFDDPLPDSFWLGEE